jgi:hypothetical protein
MDVAHVRIARAGCWTAVLAALANLAACATSVRGPGGPAAMFRAQVGKASEAVAPGLRSAWYVQRLPVQYTRVGLAGWRTPPDGAADGLGAWLSRLIGRPGTAQGTPSAIAALGADLPVPSLVEVTDLKTFKTVTVRVDDNAQMADRIIQLPAAAARALGVQPGQPLTVRLRYVAPLLAYNQPPTLRYVLLRPPQVVAAVAIQAAEPATAAVVAAPAPRLILASLASLPRPIAPPRAADAEPPPALRGEFTAPTRTFRIEVAAFAVRTNAARAMSRLSSTGQAAIVPLKRGGVTLYRVLVVGPRDDQAAERLRAHVAELGFTDARLIHPL